MLYRARKLEGVEGFEPPNSTFAECPLRPLEYTPLYMGDPGILTQSTDPQSLALTS